jgi:hypothetical protein
MRWDVIGIEYWGGWGIGYMRMRMKDDELEMMDGLGFGI